MRSKRSSCFLPLTGLVAIVLGTALGVQAQLPDVIGRVTSLFGTPTLESGGSARKLDLGMGFSNRDRISTGSAGAVSLLLATNSVVKLDANTSARVTEEQARTTVSLEAGTLELFVANRTPAMGSLIVRDGGATCEASHAVFWASYEASTSAGYYACEDASLTIRGKSSDQPVTLHPGQSATFRDGKLVAVAALDRKELATHVRTLSGLARIAQRQGVEVAAQRSRAVDVEVAVEQIAGGGTPGRIVAPAKQSTKTVSRPTGSASNSDQAQTATTATPTETGTPTLPAAAPSPTTPVLPAAAVASPVTLPPAAVPGAPVVPVVAAPSTPAAAAAVALPAVSQEVVNAVSTTPPVAVPVTVAPVVAVVPTVVTPVETPVVAVTPVTPVTPAVAPTVTVTPTTGTPAAPTAVVTPPVETPTPAVTAAATVTPSTPTVAPIAPAPTAVVSITPPTVTPPSVTPPTVAPTASLAASSVAAPATPVPTAAPSATVTGGSTSASVSSAIQSQSVGSSVTPPAPAFDVTVQLDPGQHLSFNVADATAGGAGSNTVAVTVTAGGKTYLEPTEVTLTPGGTNFSPSVKPGAVQLEVQASSGNSAPVIAGINITSTVQSGSGSTNESLNPGDAATLNINANDSPDVTSQLARSARHRVLRGSGAPGSGPPSADRLRGGGVLRHSRATPPVKP